MAGYTSQIGYPLVTLQWADPAVSEVTGRGILTISQQRHFFSPLSAAIAPPGQAAYAWWVPLTLLSGSAGPNPVTAAAAAAIASGGFTTAVWASTIGNASAPFDLGSHGWVKANANASGFFRVNYPVNVWRVLAAGARAQLSGSSSSATPLSALDRAQLLDDLWTLAEGGGFLGAGINTSLALELSSAILPLETAYEVWMPALSHLSELRGLLFGDDGTVGGNAACLSDMQAVAVSYLSQLVAYLGWGNATSNDPPLIVTLRSSALSAASGYNLPSVVATASSYFAQWAAQYAGGNNNPTAVPSDLQAIVLANAVRWGVTAPARGGGYATAFDILLAATAATDDAATKRRYLNALTASRDAGQLTRLLNVSLDTAIVRSQDTVSVLTGVAANPVGRPIAWAFAKANWAVLMDRYGAGGFALSDLVSATSKYFTSQASYDDVSAWYGSHPMSGASLEWQQSLEAIAARSAWRSQQLAATCAALRGMVAS